MPETLPLDLALVRSCFPALSGDWVFLDNAGGSQILGAVAERIADYLTGSNVQLGASYEVSRRAEARVAEGQAALATLVNAGDPSEVVIGPSTSMLLRTLATSIGRTLAPGDEIVVTNCDHEANVGPWLDLRRSGIEVRSWNVDPESLELRLEDLDALFTERTRLVAATHVSNVLGTVNPVKEWARFVHDRGALLCVDGVAFAPHRAVDVRDLDADFYSLSLYKVYGPHLAVLFAKREHLERLPGCNHFFLESEIPYKLQPGNVNYELTWGAAAIVDYLAELGSGAPPGRGEWVAREAPIARAALERAFGAIEAHEEALASRLLEALRDRSGVRIVGRGSAGAKRVPTVSFVVEGKRSSEIPPHTDREGIGIRYGDFYAKRLIDSLGLAERDGVVRVSLVHYNTVDEVDRLIEVLDPVL